jgi:uncharacterized protein
MGPSALVLPGPTTDLGVMNQVPDVSALPEHACWHLLRSAEVGRLALCIDGRVDIFPINYVVDHGTIVFRTGAGSKLAGLRANPWVAFEVDGYDLETNEAWSVVIKGRSSEAERLHEQIETIELPLFPWHADPKAHVVRIEPESTTGRRFGVVDYTAWDSPVTGVRRAPPD